ncbi:probable cysteine protease ATG4 [Kluyveromyces marxianus]|uniref:Cysteine protease ATG4 n=2 Tax=Kluyveromyces marxianus TaxID=4911 RepID=ATG4_KLUMD|nr:probable cysteine protease ATG4 [Kluyveromyces marxianus DMKU3-1042]W0TGM7.1 RecName: Full=Cysteine protease ATG4; AltName: Full=Autophagy-related protein 4 [Kluyveromyces marxianus DMKU3-1042]QGN16975.1 putative cysteine protease ATG4 [Kluyveromyces marxianus]BAO41269.1 probable cysteine protease ATG4 [Kluyveromyces marxianus DMKU3-1042]BAP72716.1 probable cysteine protease ATG4 [Kluyveromyces marxianus]
MEFLTKITQQLGLVGEIDKVGSVFVLGEEYRPYIFKTQGKADDAETAFGSFLGNAQTNPQLLSDIETRIFFTYRTQFTPIPRDEEGPSPINLTLFFRDNPINTLENVLTDPDSFYSDIGWGCMIRTGQSLLANAIQRVKQTREFRVNLENIDIKEMSIIQWFQDDWKYPLSLHNFVKVEGKKSGMKPGQWFGPSSTARSIQSLINDFPDCGIDRCLISPQSADIYEDEMIRVFEENKRANVLLLFATRLGVNEINSIYWSDIFQILKSSYSVGIAGGKPSSSLYFFGYQNDYLFYLDPHQTQSSSLDMDDNSYYRSCHGHRFSKIHISETDPSMLLGMLISGKAEWDLFKDEFKNSRIIQFVASKPSDDIYEGVDLSPGSVSVHSIQSDLQDTGDYIDVGNFMSEKANSSQPSKNEEFENVKCKNQRILICENPSETEIEQVLVEDSTTDN